MAHISESLKEEIKQRANLLDVVSSFTEVKKKGNHYVALCPFHEDSNPSLIIYPETETFTCFSCGAGSKNHTHVQSPDVFSFVKAALNINFYEALEWLANRYHIEIPPDDVKTQKKFEMKQRWFDYCNRASERFQNNLKTNPEAVSYLISRGLTKQDVEKWKIGYGDEIDRDFINTKDRIVFPFFDEQARIISFTGRTMLSEFEMKHENEKRKQNDQMPIVKYQDRFPFSKNHPQYDSHPYPSFEKGNYLYGLHLAKDSIKKKQSAILVEGWLDVITLHRAGITNAVGTMGLSFTETHAKKLKQAGAKQIIIMRDADLAGQKAIARDAKQCLQNDLIPYVIELPHAMDPHDFICSFDHLVGDQNVENHLDQQTKLYAFYVLDLIYQSYDQRIAQLTAHLTDLKNKRLNEMMHYVHQFSDPSTQYSMIEYMQDRFQIQKDYLQMKDRSVS